MDWGKSVKDRTGVKQWNFENPSCTLHKGPKRHNICRILPPNQKSCKNVSIYTWTSYQSYDFISGAKMTCDV